MAKKIKSPLANFKATRTFDDLLKDARKTPSLKQKDLKKTYDLSPATLSKYRKEIKENPLKQDSMEDTFFYEKLKESKLTPSEKILARVNLLTKDRLRKLDRLNQLGYFNEYEYRAKREVITDYWKSSHDLAIQLAPLSYKDGLDPQEYFKKHDWSDEKQTEFWDLYHENMDQLTSLKVSGIVENNYRGALDDSFSSDMVD